MPRLHDDFRARQRTTIRPRAIAYQAPRDTTQMIAGLIMVAILGAAIGANEMLNAMGWLQ